MTFRAVIRSFSVLILHTVASIKARTTCWNTDITDAFHITATATLQIAHRQAYLYICTSAQHANACSCMHMHASPCLSYPTSPSSSRSLSLAFSLTHALHPHMNLIHIYMTSIHMQHHIWHHMTYDINSHATSHMTSTQHDIWHQYTCNITYDINATPNMTSTHMQHHIWHQHNVIYHINATSHLTYNINTHATLHMTSTQHDISTSLYHVTIFWYERWEWVCCVHACVFACVGVVCCLTVGTWCLFPSTSRHWSGVTCMHIYPLLPSQVSGSLSSLDPLSLPSYRYFISVLIVLLFLFCVRAAQAIRMHPCRTCSPNCA
jgi:hypothetical protein